MCWSWQVSLSFVVFQIIALGYVFFRNKYVDRWYVLVCLPFLGQEICQFVNWAWGDIDKVDPETHMDGCTQINLIVSKCLMIDAFLIPLFVSLFTYKTSYNTNKFVNLMWKYWFYFQLISYLIIVPIMALDNECVAIGPNGHQKWPPLFTPHYFTVHLGETITTIIISVYYYPSIVLAAIFYKPLWIAWMPAIYSIVSIITLFITIGEEAYSVWCWSCACITLWVLTYYPLAKWMVKQFMKKKNEQRDNQDLNLDHLFGDNCFTNVFFKNTQVHFEKYFLLPANMVIDYSDDPNSEERAAFKEEIQV